MYKNIELIKDLEKKFFDRYPFITIDIPTNQTDKFIEDNNVKEIKFEILNLFYDFLLANNYIVSRL